MAVWNLLYQNCDTYRTFIKVKQKLTLSLCSSSSVLGFGNEKTPQPAGFALIIKLQLCQWINPIGVHLLTPKAKVAPPQKFPLAHTRCFHYI